MIQALGNLTATTSLQVTQQPKLTFFCGRTGKEAKVARENPSLLEIENGATASRHTTRQTLTQYSECGSLGTSTSPSLSGSAHVGTSPLFHPSNVPLPLFDQQHLLPGPAT